MEPPDTKVRRNSVLLELVVYRNRGLRDEDIRRIMRLCDSGEPLRKPEILQCYGPYPLHEAVLSGHIEDAKEFLEFGFSPNVTKFDGSNHLLYEVCRQGRLKCVELLISYGAEVNTYSIDGRTPLWFASARGSLECIRLLLSHGADVNPPLVLSTPLHEACKRGSSDCTAVLINAGAQPNVSDCRYGAPLHAATSYNRTECIRLLLQAGAAVNSIILPAVNSIILQPTALHIAAEKSYYEAACVLLEFGANVYARNSRNKTPVELTSYQHGPLYDMLVEYTVTPPGLKDLCRRKIRSLCGAKCIDVLQKLNLPQPLYSYLMHLTLKKKK